MRDRKIELKWASEQKKTYDTILKATWWLKQIWRGKNGMESNGMKKKFESLIIRNKKQIQWIRSAKWGERERQNKKETWLIIIFFTFRFCCCSRIAFRFSLCWNAYVSVCARERWLRKSSSLRFSLSLIFVLFLLHRK